MRHDKRVPQPRRELALAQRAAALPLRLLGEPDALEHADAARLFVDREERGAEGALADLLADLKLRAEVRVGRCCSGGNAAAAWRAAGGLCAVGEWGLRRCGLARVGAQQQKQQRCKAPSGGRAARRS